MAGFPQHPPFSDFARAVQAYAYARNQGGSLRQAEQAAERAFPGVDIPSVARAAGGAQQAAQALGGSQGAASRIFGAAASKTQTGTETEYTVTVAYYYTPGGVMGLHMGVAQRSSALQVAVPIGTPAAQVRQMVEQALQDAVEGPQSDYPGTLTGWTALTVIAT